MGDREELIQTGLSIGGQGAVTPGTIRVWCPPHQAATSSNLEQVGWPLTCRLLISKVVMSSPMGLLEG